MLSTLFVVFASIFAAVNFTVAAYWIFVSYGFVSNRLRTADAYNREIITRLCWLQVRYSFHQGIVWLVVVLAVLVV